jgi:hypothetical protein
MKHTVMAVSTALEHQLVVVTAVLVTRNLLSSVAMVSLTRIPITIPTIKWAFIMKKQLSTTFLLTVTTVSGMLSMVSFAGAQSVGNTVNNISVSDTLGTGNAVTTNRNSRSEIRNSGGSNVHNDIQIGVHDGCGRSVVNNNVNHQGSIGAQVSVNVDLCNPAAGAAVGRQNTRR